MVHQNFWPIFGLVVFLVSTFLVWSFRHYAVTNGFLDIPNERSSHQIATPRGGGIVFVLIWLAVITSLYAGNIITSGEWLLFAPATALVSLIGFFDDKRPLSPKIRLCTQFLAALFCLAALGGLPSLHLWGPAPTVFPLGELGELVGGGSSTSFLFLRFATIFSFIGIIFGSLLGILWIMWSTNLFNFMDGTDGIAAIEAIFVLIVGGLLFWLKGHSHLALIPWIMVLAVAGFLVWNWPKARIFMGDAGSYCLGFLIAILSLVGDAWYNIPVTLWIILYGVFWFDATITLLRRIRAKRNLAVAHKEHAYQRLHQAGFSHGQVLYVVIFLNSILAAVALWANVHQEWMVHCLLFSVVLLSLFYLWVERLKPMDTVSK